MPHSDSSAPQHTAVLLLADGSTFYGYGIGNTGIVTGEICFNTSLTGYQEILTDPSYKGQIITFTFPHIGNVGTNEEDIESEHITANGLIIRELITPASNFRSTSELQRWLSKHKMTGICGIDTRALTRMIRLKGPQNCLIVHTEEGKLPSVVELKKKLDDVPDLDGLELAKSVTTHSMYDWNQTRWKLGKGYGTTTEQKYHVVAIDYGDKLNILRSLASRGCKVTVVPADISAKDIMSLKPDGIFLSNGPGDPAATAEYAVPVIKELIDANIPVFGICLGHQLLALALGAQTEKMHQGHRGANHPVKNHDTEMVEITSQNHGFVVTLRSIPEHVEVTHTSLFDGTVEGVRHKSKPAFSVQYHPESSPGPHDSQYLFDKFVKLMETHAKA